MTIENSEDAAQRSVSDLADQPAAQRPSAAVEAAPLGSVRAEANSSPVLELSSVGTTHDSAPPLSRKLAPPPKPKRDSGMASAPPSPHPPGEVVDLLASSSALKAPLTPSISYPAPALDPTQSSGASEAAAQSVPPLRASSPALAAEEREAAGVPRPFSAPPRPRSEPPPSLAPAASASVAPPARSPSSPPSSSAIFAMRIIAVGESVRPPAVQEQPGEPDPNAYPTSPARLGNGERRSSRPALPAVNVAPATSVMVPPAAAVPSSVRPAEDAPSIEVRSLDLELPIDVDVPIDVELPAPAATTRRAASEPAIASSSAAPLSTGVVLPPFPATAAVPDRARPSHSPSASPVTAPSVAPAASVASTPSVAPAPSLVSTPSFAPAPSLVAAPSLAPAASAPEPTSVAPEASVSPEAAIAAQPPTEAAPSAAPSAPPRPGFPAVEPLAEALPAVEPARPRVPSFEELTDADVAPVSSERSAAALDAEELGREDAISMPPEEVAALLHAEAQAKADAAKPPPPPKRAPGTPPSAPPAVDAAAAPPVAKEPPPTPDLAAAKAAQRAKTRQPWWEDLFNEDFMRASSRVSDEQIRREVTFIEESLGVAAGGVVLDLGCGSGHHAVEFASRGYGVVGYDLSLYQLALAADVAQERSQKINFLQGDMREMAFEEMFDGVFCWNTTFGYFEEDKNLAVAQRVFRALRPGGMFLIDVLNRDFAAASSPCTVWYEGDACVCMDDMSVDYISSRLRVKRSIILDDGRTKESLFSLRLYSLHELGKLLHDVGFRVTEASGHPATPGVFFGPNSPRIIMLAQRP